MAADAPRPPRAAWGTKAPGAVSPKSRGSAGLGLGLSLGTEADPASGAFGADEVLYHADVASLLARIHCFYAARPSTGDASAWG